MAEQRETYYTHEVSVGFEFEPGDQARGRVALGTGHDMALTSLGAKADLITGKVGHITFSGFYLKQDGTVGRKQGRAQYRSLRDVDDETQKLIREAVDDACERERDRLAEWIAEGEK